MNVQLKASKCSLFDSLKIRVSSVKRRWDTTLPTPHLPLAKKPWMEPPSIAFFKILESTSIVKIKRKGERGSPYLRPLELAKKLAEVSLIKIETQAKEMHHLIHLTNLALKLIFSMTTIKNSQFTWSFFFLSISKTIVL